MSLQENVPTPGAWGSNQLFPLLAEYIDPDGNRWLYAKASTDIAQYAAVAVTSAGVAAALTKALADAGHRIGAVQVAVDGTPTAAYGWVQMAGAMTVKGGALVAPSAPIYTTAAAGVVDDESSAQTRLYGVRAVSTGTGTASGSSFVVQNNILT